MVNAHAPPWIFLLTCEIRLCLSKFFCYSKHEHLLTGKQRYEIGPRIAKTRTTLDAVTHAAFIEPPLTCCIWFAYIISSRAVLWICLINRVDLCIFRRLFLLLNTLFCSMATHLFVKMSVNASKFKHLCCVCMKQWKCITICCIHCNVERDQWPLIHLRFWFIFMFSVISLLGMSGTIRK